MTNKEKLAAVIDGKALPKDILLKAVDAASFGLQRNGEDLFHNAEGEFTLSELVALNSNRSGAWGAYASGYAPFGEVLGRVPGIGVPETIG